MNFQKILLVGSLTLGSSLMAAHVAWFELFPTYRYQELSVSCREASSMPLSLAVETDDQLQVVRAQFRSAYAMFPSESFWWTREEMAALKLETDDQQRIWVRDLRLSVRLLDWVMKNLESDTLGKGCPPRESVKSVGPVPYGFVFEKESLVGTPRYSGQGSFYGYRRNGNAFELKLEFAQIHHRPQKP